MTIKFEVGKLAPNWKTNPDDWSKWFKSFCDYHAKTKRENAFDLVLPELVNELEENFNDASKRVKGIGRRILIAKIKSKLPNLNSGQISRAIKKCINLQIVNYISQSKTRKLIIKGQYYKTYARSVA